MKKIKCGKGEDQRKNKVDKSKETQLEEIKSLKNIYFVQLNKQNLQ